MAQDPFAEFRVDKQNDPFAQFRVKPKGKQRGFLGLPISPNAPRKEDIGIQNVLPNIKERLGGAKEFGLSTLTSAKERAGRGFGNLAGAFGSKTFVQADDGNRVFETPSDQRRSLMNRIEQFGVGLQQIPAAIGTAVLAPEATLLGLAKPELQTAISKIPEPVIDTGKKIINKIPKDIRNAASNFSLTTGIGTIAKKLELAGLAAKEIPKLIGSLAEVSSKIANKEAGTLGVAFGELRKAKQIKNIGKAEKLATEILDPSKKDIKLAKLAGNSTSNSVKEYVKIAEVASNFDDALNKIKTKVKNLFTRRNKIIENDNFTINRKRPIIELEDNIAKFEKNVPADNPKLRAMKKVLKDEKDWISKNNPDRVRSQARKEFVYNEAKPIFKKQDLGNATIYEEGKAKAYELLGIGYKDVVENGDKVIAEINSQYGGLLGAEDLLASQSALAAKAKTPTLVQNAAGKATDLVMKPLGTGSAAAVTKLAFNQEKSLAKLTKKLISLRKAVKNGETAGFIEKQLKELADELPKLKGEIKFPKKTEAIKQLPVGTIPKRISKKPNIVNVENKIINLPKTPTSVLDRGKNFKQPQRKGRPPNIFAGGVRPSRTILEKIKAEKIAKTKAEAEAIANIGKKLTPEVQKANIVKSLGKPTTWREFNSQRMKAYAKSGIIHAHKQTGADWQKVKRGLKIKDL